MRSNAGIWQSRIFPKADTALILVVDSINICYAGQMSDQQSDVDVDKLRAFNRVYTSRLGLLRPRLDQSPFSLTEARLLYELATRPVSTAAAIARDLGIDRAQLSRTLARFAERGLVTAHDDPTHGRNKLLALTKAGRAAFAALEGNTREAVAGLIGRYSPPRRARLLQAATLMTEILEDARGEVRLRGLEPGNIGWIVHRQAVLYAEEFGWNADYEALIARILADFHQTFDPSREAAWVAEINGRVVGSIFLVKGDTEGIGKLRLLYVEPDTRRAGIGAMLVSACIERARAVGFHRLELWTNSVLSAARRIYEGAGFQLIRETPHHSFGHDLIGQTWSLDLHG